MICKKHHGLLLKQIVKKKSSEIFNTDIKFYFLFLKYTKTIDIFFKLQFLFKLEVIWLKIEKIWIWVLFSQFIALP